MVIKLKLISVNLPEAYIKVLEILVAEGKFPNRSEVTLKGEELAKDFAITLDSEFTASLFAFEKL